MLGSQNWSKTKVQLQQNRSHCFEKKRLVE